MHSFARWRNAFNKAASKAHGHLLRESLDPLAANTWHKQVHDTIVLALGLHQILIISLGV